MTNQIPLAACRAARVPMDGLRALAPLRSKAGVKIVLGDEAWVEWEGDRPDVVAALLAVPGVEFLERRENRWYLRGHHLPATFVPPTQTVSIERAIVPDSFVPVAAGNCEQKRLPLALVRCELPQPTTAICCAIESLQAWADSATKAEIAAVQGARNGSMVWLRGSKLPVLPDAERFWGEQVWRRLGWRTEPDWPEAALREAAGVGTNEILVVRSERTEAIPIDAFRPLTRAAIRLANV